MRLRLVAVISLAVALGSLLPAAASANEGASYAFTFLLGQGYVAGLPPSADTAIHGPQMAIAANGETITMTGTGKFNFRQEKGSNEIRSPGAAGGGTFSHKAASGSLVAGGTWTATELLDFESYGNGAPQGIPTNNY